MPRLFGDWLQSEAPFRDCPDLACFAENDGGRALVEEALTTAITDHLIGLSLLERLTGPRALAAAEQRVPKSPRERSGDFGEILASCWIEECTTFRLPIRRLRYKADREFPMQGDDLIAVSDDGPARLLKGEPDARFLLARPANGRAVARMGA